MANLKQTKKRALQNVKSRLVNQARKSEIKTITRKFNDAVAAKDTKTAQELLRLAESKIARARGKGVFVKNTAGRKISKLAKQLAK
jgi:small subunit ribosomal protein S20